jgi:hypothetical protein
MNRMILSAVAALIGMSTIIAGTEEASAVVVVRRGAAVVHPRGAAVVHPRVVAPRRAVIVR